MERMYGVLLPMDHFYCQGFFYIGSFALNTLIILPCSKESNCRKKSFQNLFPSLQKRLNSHQENILISLWLLFLLWDHSFISKYIYKVIFEISVKYLGGPFDINELHVRPNKYYVPCFGQAVQWVNHWFNNWSKTCMINDLELFKIKCRSLLY